MNCPISKIKGRWERRKDARPQELLAAALDLFVERGYAATRLDDVASRAGVSKGTLYLYFTNKEDLFKAVIKENLVPVLGEAEQMIDQYQGHSTDLLKELIMTWWERIGDTQLSGITKLMMAESGNFPDVAQFYHDEVISRGNAMIERALERGMERGEMRRLDAVEVTQVIVAPVLMLMLWKHSFVACQSKPTAPISYLNAFIDLLFNGLLTTKVGNNAENANSMASFCSSIP
ncbi:MAG TPA: TetR/AcrR family transcriptional regulator [Burkholderiaceae bacterium]|jgi:AcrR family transcriptional regulator|nr:TetR/AcrR family transcriptional regulator [Burkholderiaceae bacterium]